MAARRCTMAGDEAGTQGPGLSVAAGTLVGGRYLILGSLGVSATGTVFRAHDELLSRDVAIKLITPPTGEDPDWARRGLRELQAASVLAHPHILPILEARNDADGRVLVVEPLVRGTDLQTVLRREGPLSAERAVEVISAIASVLDTAHSIGLVHRDVKPANILVDSNRDSNHIYLIDFGIAKLTSDRLSTLEGLAGTPEYMAPEQVTGLQPTPPTDLYSLGLVLYTLLTGQPPFHGETPTATMDAQLYESPPQATALRPDLPAGIDAVVARALAKSRTDRFSSGSELAQAMRDALASGRVRYPVPASPLPTLLALSRPSHSDAGPPGATDPSATRNARLDRRSLSRGFTDGVGGVFDLFHGIRRQRWRPPAFGESLAQDARELCRELGLAIQNANGSSEETGQ
jgi:serine/threonine protein kinase, bacterial